MPQNHLTFEIALANYMGVINANLEELLDRNPDLPIPARAALARLIGKTLPWTNVEFIVRSMKAFED